MTLPAAVAVPAVIASLLGAGFVANEWSHGGMSEAIGLGHHHALDTGNYHCARHDDPHHGDDHAHHMHGNHTAPHDECPGTHQPEDP